MNPITRTLALPLLAIALQPAFAAQAVGYGIAWCSWWIARR